MAKSSSNSYRGSNNLHHHLHNTGGNTDTDRNLINTTYLDAALKIRTHPFFYHFFSSTPISTQIEYAVDLTADTESYTRLFMLCLHYTK